ncbi:MAG: hypothetical protein K0R28_1837 [Paenibacillus sp.]|nr:hypothetical protein [Paenibacillus sp.]
MEIIRCSSREPGCSKHRISKIRINKTRISKIRINKPGISRWETWIIEYKSLIRRQIKLLN